MLREKKYQNLPSYELGLEQGLFQTASKMVKEFNLSIDKIAKTLNISEESI